jgi:ABC-type spermidine/putrescine transport system permease subunit II
MLLPALVSGWLLSLMLLLDDLVISSFLSGPGATIIIVLMAVAVATAAFVSGRRESAGVRRAAFRE